MDDSQFLNALKPYYHFRKHIMERRIVGFHQDEERHWVAELECGHNQHVRHDPPWTLRPWVVTPEGRGSALGKVLDCKKCDLGASRDWS